MRLSADPIICFFFKPDIAHLTHTLKHPGHIAQHTVHGIVEHTPIAGIYVTYAGYVTISDMLGEVRFPRKQRENVVTILVTPEIEPISLFENTITLWNLMPHQPAIMYSLQETYDPKKNEYFWQSHKIDLPHNNQIPVSTIVIFANPRDIVIPSEITKTVKSANLLLPPLYVKKGIDIMSHGIEMLTIRHLFRPVTEKKQQTPLRLTTHLLN